MSTSNRIVLVDTVGDELFSGSSLLSELPPSDEENEEPLPATLRSSVFVRTAEPADDTPIIIEEDDHAA